MSLRCLAGVTAAAGAASGSGLRVLTSQSTSVPSGSRRMRSISPILREPDGTLVLCEVKTRSPDPLAAPAAAVTPAKQRRLIRTAEYYLQHTGQSDEPVRFDVAEVTPLDSGRWMVHIIKGAFTA